MFHSQVTVTSHTSGCIFTIHSVGVSEAGMPYALIHVCMLTANLGLKNQARERVQGGLTAIRGSRLLPRPKAEAVVLSATYS